MLKNLVILEIPNKLQFFKNKCPSVPRISHHFYRLANAWLDSFFMSVWLGVSAKVELTVIYFEFVILSEVFLIKLPLLKPEGRAVIGQNL